LSLTVICDGDCLCALLLHISRAAYRRLRVDETAQARSVESGAAVAAGHTTTSTWSRAPYMSSCQCPLHTTLTIAVLGAEHVPRHTAKRVKIPGGVRESCARRCFKFSENRAQALVKPHSSLGQGALYMVRSTYRYGVIVTVVPVRCHSAFFTPGSAASSHPLGFGGTRDAPCKGRWRAQVSV
jgi:hypothetical protein